MNNSIPKPTNENISSYSHGSSEKNSLKAKIKQLKSENIKVPLNIDGEELTQEFESKYNVDISDENFDWCDEIEGHGVADELFDNLVQEWFDNV